MILVVANEDGTYTEFNPERAVLWFRDRYSSPDDYVLECVNCERGIQDTEFFICLDLGDVAHVWCVKVEGDQPGPLERWP